MRTPVLLALALVLCGCSDWRSDKVGEPEARQFYITWTDPPKHFGVRLVDVQSGRATGRESVSKHCNRWREVELPGTVWLLQQTWRRRSDGELWYQLGGKSKICPGN